MSTFVGKPNLEITKTGPAVAQLNEEVSYTITVANKGTAVVRDVTIVDELPDGLTNPNGKTLNFTVGDLQANESKTVNVTATASQRGRFCNVAKANSTNVGSVQAEACTVVQQHNMGLTVTCDKEQFIGKAAKSSFTVANQGDTKLAGVVITATWPKELKWMSDDCGFQKTDETKAVLNLGDMEPGTEKTCSTQVISKFAGEHCMTITVTTAEGITKSENCCTRWRGFPALLMEVVDDPDPLLVGEDTVYTIAITNQGTAEDTNIQIKGIFPAEIDPIEVSGDTVGKIEGKTIVFEPYPTLQPKARVQWQVKARGVQRGDSRVKFMQTSTLLVNPVTEEESTQVY